ARANRGRDPLYLFAALQRQLGYPEVPRPRPRDDTAARLDTLQARVRELESRVKLLEAEAKGGVDLSQFLARPELLQGPPEGADGPYAAGPWAAASHADDPRGKYHSRSSEPSTALTAEAPRMPILASSRCGPRSARPAMNRDIVNPIPARQPAPVRTFQPIS